MPARSTRAQQVAADAELIAHLETVYRIDIETLGIAFGVSRDTPLTRAERRLLAYVVIYGPITSWQEDRALSWVR